MEIIYKDEDVLICIKPAGVLSTDEPGGLPELVRQELGDEKADVRTVHRLDRAVSGLMVLARGAKAASELSRQIREGEFEKEYLAVVQADQADSGEESKSASVLINQYGTYEIQRTQDTENIFPLIMQGLPREWENIHMDTPVGENVQ